MPSSRPLRDRRLGRLVLGAIAASVVSLAAAAPASAQFAFSSFVTNGDASAGWIDEPAAPLGATDQQSIALFVNGTGPTDFNDSALAVFQDFATAPAPSPPSFDFKVSAVGGSGGSVRLVIRFADGGRGELRPVTLQAGTWIHVAGAQSDWDNLGGSCGTRTGQSYAQMLACHPGGNVTNIELINDSGWLHPGGFQILIDNVSYGGVTISDIPPPVAGESIVATQLKGDVVLSVPGGVAAASRARASAVGGTAVANLKGSAPVPVDTSVDTDQGRVNLLTATPAGRRHSSNFFGGSFKLEQSGKVSARGLTTLLLKGSLAGCRPRAGSANAASTRAEASRRRRRHLWGSGRGRFRTRGRSSSATVRGTKWLTVDRCDGTLTVVRDGVVAVRDFRRKKTVVLHDGGRYLARRR